MKQTFKQVAKYEFPYSEYAVLICKSKEGYVANTFGEGLERIFGPVGELKVLRAKLEGFIEGRSFDHEGLVAVDLSPIELKEGWLSTFKVKNFRKSNGKYLRVIEGGSE